MTHTLALIGTGHIAQTAHLPAFIAEKERIQVVALCNRNPEKARRLGEQFGVEKIYDDPRQMLEETRPEIVSICTPNRSHYELTKLALEHGAHVLCEKPVALSLEEARELYALAEEKGLKLMSCQSLRYLAEYRAAKEAVESGILGRIYAADATWSRHRGIPNWGTFHIKAENACGCMGDLGVHMLDALFWLAHTTGVKSVSGSMGAPLVHTLPAESWGVSNDPRFKMSDFDVEEIAMGTLLTEEHLRANFRITWASHLPIRPEETLLITEVLDRFYTNADIFPI